MRVAVRLRLCSWGDRPGRPRVARRSRSGRIAAPRVRASVGSVVGTESHARMEMFEGGRWLPCGGEPAGDGPGAGRLDCGGHWLSHLAVIRGPVSQVRGRFGVQAVLADVPGGEVPAVIDLKLERRPCVPAFLAWPDVERPGGDDDFLHGARPFRRRALGPGLQDRFEHGPLLFQRSSLVLERFSLAFEPLDQRPERGHGFRMPGIVALLALIPGMAHLPDAVKDGPDRGGSDG